MKKVITTFVIYLLLVGNLYSQTDFTNEFLDLDNNQVPTGWNLTTQYGGPGITNGRLQANTNDGKAILTKTGSVPVGTDSIKLEYDGNISNSSFGLYNWIYIYTSTNDSVLFRDLVATSNYGNNNRATVKFNGTNLLNNNFPLEYTDYHYTVILKNDEFRYSAEKISNGSVLFDTTFVLANGSFDISTVNRIDFKASTTTGSNSWVDNLSLSFGSQTAISNLIAHFPFNEASGITTFDSTANSYDGTLVGDVTLGSQGVFGNAVFFGSGDGRIEVPSLPDSLFSTNDFSISLWYKADGIFESKFFNKRSTSSCSNASGPTIGGGINSTGSAVMTFRGNDNVKHTLSDSVQTNNNLWHHFTSIRKSDSLFLFVDGVLKATKQIGSNVDFTSTLDFWIGKSHYCTGSPYEGLMDDFKVYNYALSQNEVNELYVSNSSLEFTTLDFGQVAIGNTQNLSVELYASVIGDLVIDSVNFDSGNLFSTNLTPQTIPISNSLSFTVTFSPTTNGNFSDKLNIYSDSSSTPTHSLILNGEAGGFFDGEFLDLNNNLAPEGWSISNKNNGQITNGRLQATPTDSWVKLTKIGSVPSGIDSVKFEYDANISYAFWGMASWVRFFTSTGDSVTFADRMAQYNFGSNNRAQVYFNNSFILNQNYPLEYTDYHYTIILKNDEFRYIAEKISDGSVLFDTTLVMATGSFDIETINKIDVRAETTTDGTAWIDNISLNFDNNIPKAFGSISEGSLDFGSVQILQPDTLSLKLNSIGDLDLNINSVSFPNGLYFETDLVSQTISNGDSLEFDVIFEPTLTGSFSDTLTIFTNDFENPEFSIPLTGIGENLVQFTGVDSGLVVYLKFSETSGISVADATGYENTGTLNQNVSLGTAGFLGNGVSFGSADSWISVENSPQTEFGTEDFTISLWLKTFATDVTLFNSRDNSTDKRVSGEIDDFGILTAELLGSDGTLHTLNSATNTSNSNDWDLFTLVREGTSVKLYVDGLVKDSTTLSSSVDFITGEDFWIGKNQFSGGSGSFYGKMDDFRIYDRALSASEVNELAQTKEFTNELVNLDNNQVPNDWSFESSNANSNIQNGRMEAVFNAPSSASASLSKIGKVEQATNILELKFDAPIQNTAELTRSNLELTTFANDVFGFYVGFSTNTFGNFVNVQVLQNGLQIEEINIPSTSSTFADYNFSFSVKNDWFKLFAEKISDGTVLFDSTLTLASGTFDLLEIQKINFESEANEGTNWMDNLEIGIGELSDVGISNLSISPSTDLCPGNSVTLNFDVENLGANPFDAKIEIDLDNNGIINLDSTLYSFPSGTQNFTLTTSIPTSVSSGTNTVKANVSLIGSYFDQDLSNNLASENYSVQIVNDVEILSLAFDTQPTLEEPTFFQVLIRNNGCNTVSGQVHIDWFNDGTNIEAKNFNNLAPNNFALVEIQTPSWTYTGNYNLSCSTTLTNGIVDEVQSNNQVSAQYNVIYTFPYPVFRDNFENGNGLWTLTNSDPNVKWEVDNSPLFVQGEGIPFQGNACLNYNNDSTYASISPTGNSGTALLDSTVDLTFYENVSFVFATLHEVENSTSKDERFFEYSNDNFVSDTVSIKLDNTLPQGLWTYHSIAIDQSYLNSNLSVRFRFDTVDGSNNNGAGWFVDDFGIWGQLPTSPTLILEAGIPSLVGDGVIFNASNGSGAIGGMASIDSTLSGNEGMELVQLGSGGSADSVFVASVVEIDGCENAPYIVIINVPDSVLNSGSTSGISVSHNFEFVPAKVTADSSGNVQVVFQITDCSPYFIQDDANFPLGVCNMVDTTGIETLPNGDVILNWNNSPNANSYKVFWSSDPTFPDTSETLNSLNVGNVTSWTHQGASNLETKVFYRVVAVCTSSNPNPTFTSKKNISKLNFLAKKPIKIFKKLETKKQISAHK